MAQTYNKMARAREFQEGDLLLTVADHIMKGMSASKLTANWKGPMK